MEIKFNKTACPCLRKVTSQVQTQEQTQEVRLPDAMPDIGRVLGSWGQVLIRSKEWRGNAMSVSGGVMAWVLYAPEDGTEPKSMDAWIPFQMRWDFPETQRDGAICITPMLKAVDARSTSARKLMVRANVSLLGEALEPVEPEIYVPEGIPEDVELLRSSYPMVLPREAGEKLFQVDEELIIPGTYPQVKEILRYEICPEILEQKVMAGRLVFRGKSGLHLLYESENGMQTWDTEVPYSQYAELDTDHSPNANAWIMPIVTGLELYCDDQGRLQMKCGIAAQFVVYDRVMVDVVEDAYSPRRQVKTQKDELQMPMQLDHRLEMLQCEVPMEVEAERILDASCLWDHPSHRQNGNMVEFNVPGQFQMLYYDREGNLQNATARTECTWQMPSDPMNHVDAYTRCAGQPQTSVNGPSVTMYSQPELEATIFADQGLPMVTGITLGEPIPLDPGRPSLIIRRAGEDRLWDIAKECGSTVAAIRKVNSLQEEPEQGSVLLIPIS